MSFAINPSLNYINIPAQHIIEIYRSKGEVQLSDARFRGHPCEAYICVSRVEKTMQAHVALLEMGIKSVFVYTSDFSADTSEDYPKVLAEAEEFVQAMGFSMERVNLEFSLAMREVIIKGISVMRPPQKKPVLRTQASFPAPEKALSVLALATAHDIAAISTSQFATASLELSTLQAELLSTRAALEKMTSEKLAFEVSAVREIAALKASLDKAAELKQLSDEKLANEIDTVKRDIFIPEIRKQEALAATLKSNLEVASRKAALCEESLNARITALQGSIDGFKIQNFQLMHELAAEKDSAAEKISQLIAEKDSLSALLFAEKTAAEDKIAALSLFETSWRDGQHREEDLCRNIDILNEQIDQLKAELETAQDNLVNESVATVKLATLEDELAAAKTEIERLIRTTVDREAVQADLTAVEAEYIRMATEKINKEAELLDALYIADAEILRLSREIEVRSQAAEMEKTALLSELKLLLVAGPPPTGALTAGIQAEKAAATVAIINVPVASSPEPAATPAQQPPTPVITAANPAIVAAALAPQLLRPEAVEAVTQPSIPVAMPLQVPVATEDDIADAPVSGEPEITNGLLNEFGSFCGSSGLSTTEFSIDPGLSVIEYSAPAEIIAILSSSNTVQAVLAGNNTQRCKGYIIATKSGGHYRAFVAWHLTESQQIVICTPEQQPADAMECTRVLQDAIAYFEIVGFMMELEDLGNSVKSYHKVIRKVPALKRK